MRSWLFSSDVGTIVQFQLLSVCQPLSWLPGLLVGISTLVQSKDVTRNSKALSLSLLRSLSPTRPEPMQSGNSNIMAGPLLVHWLISHGKNVFKSMTTIHNHSCSKLPEVQQFLHSTCRNTSSQEDSMCPQVLLLQDTRNKSATTASLETWSASHKWGFNGQWASTNDARKQYFCRPLSPSRSTRLLVFYCLAMIACLPSLVLLLSLWAKCTLERSRWRRWKWRSLSLTSRGTHPPLRICCTAVWHARTDPGRRSETGIVCLCCPNIQANCDDKHMKG